MPATLRTRVIPLLAVPSPLGSVHLFRRTIEHVYLTYAGGTPLVHLSRRAPSDKDPDLIASMFTALQSFMDDAFHGMSAGGVRSIEIGKKTHVTFGRGQWVLLYVVYSGRESNRLERRVEHEVRRLEERFADLLRAWDGEMGPIAALQADLEREWGVPSIEAPSARPSTPSPPASR